MDPSLNYRHSQVHAAELHRRAELHRLASQARAAKRDTGPAHPHLHLGGLARTVRTTFARVGIVARSAAAYASKTGR
jgi:hypothetical protein